MRQRLQRIVKVNAGQCRAQPAKLEPQTLGIDNQQGRSVLRDQPLNNVAGKWVVIGR
jgi:hypothetical protein